MSESYVQPAIKRITVQFGLPSLDEVASDTIPLSSVYEDRDSQTTFQTDPIARIRNEIVGLLEDECNLTTKGRDHIAALVEAMPMSWWNPSDLRRSLRNNSKVKDAFVEAAEAGVKEVIIHVSCDSLHFDPSFDGHNLDLVSLEPFENSVPGSHMGDSTAPSSPIPSVPKPLMRRGASAASGMGSAGGGTPKGQKKTLRGRKNERPSMNSVPSARSHSSGAPVADKAKVRSRKMEMGHGSSLRGMDIEAENLGYGLSPITTEGGGKKKLKAPHSAPGGPRSPRTINLSAHGKLPRRGSERPGLDFAPNLDSDDDDESFADEFVTPPSSATDSPGTKKKTFARERSNSLGAGLDPVPETPTRRKKKKKSKSVTGSKAGGSTKSPSPNTPSQRRSAVPQSAPGRTYRTVSKASLEKAGFPVLDDDSPTAGGGPGLRRVNSASGPLPPTSPNKTPKTPKKKSFVKMIDEVLDAFVPLPPPTNAKSGVDPEMSAIDVSARTEDLQHSGSDENGPIIPLPRKQRLKQAAAKRGKQLMKKAGIEQGPPKTLLIVWFMIAAELAFDFATTIISFRAFLDGDRCCGHTMETKITPNAVTIPFFILVMIEFSFLMVCMIITLWPRLLAKKEEDEEEAAPEEIPMWRRIFCQCKEWSGSMFLQLLNLTTILNPFFGCLMAWMLLYQSDKQECFLVLGLEGASIVLHFISVWLEDDCKTLCAFCVHCIQLIPFTTSVVLVLVYLREGGVCYLVEDQIFTFTIRGFSGCEICPPVDGIQYPPIDGVCMLKNGTNFTLTSTNIFKLEGELGDFGNKLISSDSIQGTYCGDDTPSGPPENFCFFPY